MISQTEGATVVIGLFSGRPNPEFKLVGEPLKKLANLVADTIGKEAIHAPPDPLLGEYYGFKVSLGREVTASLAIPESFSVYKNVLSINKGQTREHWRDIAKVEDFLFQQALNGDCAEVLEAIGVQPPPSVPK